MELAAMPDQGGDADQPGVIRCGTTSYGAVRQHPSIHTMRVPDLCQLLARLLEAQLLTERLRFPPLLDGHRSQFVESVIKPDLAHLQRGERAVPPTSCAGARHSLDVLDHEGTDREQVTQEGGQSPFPLPTGFRGGWQFLPALVPVLARLTTGSLAIPACAAHARTLLFGFLNTCACIGLDVQTHAKHAAFPEAGRLATSDPAPCSCGRRRHERVLMLIHYRNKDVCHDAISPFRVN